MAYHLRQALQAMRANLTATLATLTTMTLTLALLGLVSLTTLNLERVVASVEGEVKLSAFLTPSRGPQEASQKAERVQLAVQDALRFPEVESLRYVPKEQAYAELALEFPYLAEATRVVENPLPDAVEVRLVSAGAARRVAEQLRRVPGVEEVVYGEEFLERAVSAISVVRVGGYGLVVLLLVNSLFNILNTIRVAMYARRDEINVMRLIGATRGFIRAPYVLEGVGLGLLAGLFTAALVYPAYTVGASRLAALAPFLPIVQDRGVVLQALGLLVGLGVLVGFLGSLSAANRYLREVE